MFSWVPVVPPTPCMPQIRPEGIALALPFERTAVYPVSPELANVFGTTKERTVCPFPGLIEAVVGEIGVVTIVVPQGHGHVPGVSTHHDVL